MREGCGLKFDYSSRKNVGFIKDFLHIFNIFPCKQHIHPLRKIITFLLIVLIIGCSAIASAQVWKHPYQAMGLESFSSKQKDASKNYARKELEIDSSANGIYQTLREYNSKGQLILEIYENTDTVRFFYDSDDNWTYKLIRGDTIYQRLQQNDKGLIEKLELINKNRTTEISYSYDQQGNITEVHSGKELYDRCIYDSLNRILQVENYRSGYRSNVLNYSYELDTVYYSECSYNEKGERYPWPCDELKGVYTATNQISKVLSTLWSPSGPVYDELTFTYDSKDRISEISQLLSNGNRGYSRWIYENDRLVRSEHFSNGQLVQVYDYKQIE